MICLVIDKDNIQKLQSVDDVRKALQEKIREQEQFIKNVKK